MAEPSFAPWPLNTDTKCSGCSCGQWTLTLTDANTLHSQLNYGGSHHLDVVFKRAGSPPPVNISMPTFDGKFVCDFLPGGRDSRPLSPGMGCPHRAPPNRSTAPRTITSLTASKIASSPYDHCLVLNRKLNLRLSWSIDKPSSSISVVMSAATTSSSQYIAIGFRPLSYAPVGTGKNEVPPSLGTGVNFEFGMSGADIVAGSGSEGIKQYYADKYVGAPVPDNSLKLANAKAAFSNGKTEISFTRPLVGGWLTKYGVNISLEMNAGDILWSVGTMESGSITYHGANRGLRTFEWNDPSNLAPFYC